MKRSAGITFVYGDVMGVRHIVLGFVTVLGLAALTDAVEQPVRLVKPVSFAILEDYDKGDDLEEVDNDFALFNELGIDTWRGSLGWDDYEPERGRFEFSWLHRFAELAGRHHLRLRPYLGYTPKWAGRSGRDKDVWNDPPASLVRWSRFAGELARAMRVRQRRLVRDLQRGECAAVVGWDAACVRTIAGCRRSRRSRQNPVPILIGGLTFPDSDWIETICSVPGVGQSFDILPFHAYPETWTPPGVSVENYLGGLDGFLHVSDSTCGCKSIWINETGFATVPGRSERQQATWWVRAVATLLSYPRIEHIGVYEIKDLPPDREAIGDTPNHHLGLTRTDRSKNLAFYTVDMLTDLVDVGRLEVVDRDMADRVRTGRSDYDVRTV
jgi:polysaccharide biosynthesis protein PslG